MPGGSQRVTGGVRPPTSRKKPLFPLLLSGEPSIALGGIIYEKTENYHMPSMRWIVELRTAGSDPGE
jgi:hypothetical protein